MESLEGDWKQLKGKVKERWGKLTDDDLTAISTATSSKARSKSPTATPRVRLEGKSRTGTAPQNYIWLADEIETIRTELQSLAASVGRIANKQIGRAQVRVTKLTHEPRPRSRGIHLLLSQFRPWDPTE